MGLNQYILPLSKIKLSRVQRSHNPTFLNTVTRFSDYTRGLDCSSDLLNSYNPLLEVRVMLSLFHILHKSLQDTLGLLSQL
jgi:hypothetical protein